MRKFFQGFKKFITKGNVLDMAVGIILGSAFTAIVTALVNKILMPVIALITGGVSLSKMGVSINGQPMYILADGVEVLNPAANVLWYGEFIQAIINFLIIGFTLYCIVRIMMRAKGVLKPKFYGYEKKEYIQMRKSGKTKKQIEEMAKARDEEAAAKQKAEEEEKKLHTTEALLEQIKQLLINMQPKQPVMEEVQAVAETLEAQVENNEQAQENATNE